MKIAFVSFNREITTSNYHMYESDSQIKKYLNYPEENDRLTDCKSLPDECEATLAMLGQEFQDMGPTCGGDKGKSVIPPRLTATEFWGLHISSLHFTKHSVNQC